MKLAYKSHAVLRESSAKWLRNLVLALAVVPLLPAGIAEAQYYGTAGVSAEGQSMALNLADLTLSDKNQHPFSGHVHQDGDNFCRTDFSSVSARAATTAYISAKKSGLLPQFAKNKTPHNIGDERFFNVFEAGWEERTFRLIDKTSKYYLWMDVVVITDPQLPPFSEAQFRTDMIDSTPAGSINPNAGILVNNNTIYGQPPDYDLDGITDILLYQIGGGAAGYVHPADVLPGADPGVGNQADVLYIDPFRSSTSISAITAHEYVHLLHLSTGGDETFLSEGYAEYGIVLNGFGAWRSIWYLNSQIDVPEGEGVRTIWEYQLPMFYWRGLDGRDYQRGNHFFTYVSEQSSPEVVGQMLQQDSQHKGVIGLQNALDAVGGDLDEIVLGFHAANLINDLSQGPALGFIQPSRTNLHAPVTRTINGEQAVLNAEDELAYETIRPNEDLNAGSAQYIRWENVADYSLVFDAVGFEGVCSTPGIPEAVCTGSQRALRGPVRAMVYGIRPDKSVLITTILAGEDAHQLAGKFESLTLIVAHTNPGVFSTGNTVSNIQPRFRYSATWTPLSQVTSTISVSELPDVSILSQNYPNPFASHTTIPFQLTRTARVKLAVYDVLGREKAALVDDMRPAGSYTVDLDARGWASGTYFLRMEADGKLSTRIMHLVK